MKKAITNYRLIGIALVTAGIAFNTFFLGLPTAGLSIGLIAAYFIWQKGHWQPARQRLLWPYVLSIGLFVVHFGEEYFTGFYAAFPNLFGQSWSAQRFLIFNAIWLVIFGAGAAGVWYEQSIAYLIVVFFALAGGIGNGSTHIALSVWFGRYFPGTVTAPLMFASGLFLFHRLEMHVIVLWVRAAAFTMLVPGAVAWWIPQNFVHVDWTIRHSVGWIPVVFGGLLYFCCLTQFLLRGEGTPNMFFARHLGFLIGREPSRLVQQSIYRYSRNPMYIGVLTSVFGEALLFGSWNLLIYASILCVWFHLVVVFVEEPHLRRTRGETYIQYCHQTPRWLPTRLH